MKKLHLYQTSAAFPHYWGREGPSISPPEQCLQTLPDPHKVPISSTLCCGPPESSKTLSPLPAPALQILPAFSLHILAPSWTLQAVVRFWPPCSLLVAEMRSLCCDKVNLTKRQILAPGQERPFSFQQIPASCVLHALIVAMGAALSVKPGFGSAQQLKGGGRSRVGSAGSPTVSFTPWGHPGILTVPG